MTVDPDGQPADSEMRRIDAAGNAFALVALRPHTGRTHQLRVHMAHAGHPIVGDGKYGGTRGDAAAHPAARWQGGFTFTPGSCGFRTGGRSRHLCHRIFRIHLMRLGLLFPAPTGSLPPRHEGAVHRAFREMIA